MDEEPTGWANVNRLSLPTADITKNVFPSC